MTPTDLNFLTASTINLYLESLRRSGRVLLAPQDIPVLWDMIHVLTNPIAVTAVTDTARSRELTEEERQQVLQAIEVKPLVDADLEQLASMRH